uniref:Uncharacterized protein n=1 Tax=Solanum lycopersicum TaxID=4081 RepID=K4BHC4_SOLLC
MLEFLMDESILVHNPTGKNNIVNGSFNRIGEQSVFDDTMLVFVLPYPLIKHYILVLRNEQMPCPIIKNATSDLGRFFKRDPITKSIVSVEFVSLRKPVSIVPISRAALDLANDVSSILAAAKTFHLGVSRNEETLQSSVYLNVA